MGLCMIQFDTILNRPLPEPIYIIDSIAPCICIISDRSLTTLISFVSSANLKVKTLLRSIQLIILQQKNQRIGPICELCGTPLVDWNDKSYSCPLTFNLYVRPIIKFMTTPNSKWGIGTNTVSLQVIRNLSIANPIAISWFEFDDGVEAATNTGSPEDWTRPFSTLADTDTHIFEN